jgi:predicted RNA binding protein YcfA (HicA-like mRNA interferase family)
MDLSSNQALQQTARRMPPKIRELIAELERAGFVNRGGHGSHRNFVHPKVSRPVTLAGGTGDDAKHYQVRAVRMAIQEAKR